MRQVLVAFVFSLAALATANQKAINAATAFMAKAGLPKPSVAPKVRTIAEWANDSNVSLIEWGSDYAAVVSASGRMINFQNKKRELEIYRKQNRTGKSRFNDSHTAQAFATALGRKLGLPKSAKLFSFQYGRKPHEFLASWTEEPHGFPFVAGGQNGLLMRIDTQDGALLYYTADWRLTTAKPALVVSRTQAETIAAKSYSKATGIPSTPTAGRTRLGWIVGNSYKQGSRAVVKKDIARLGYVVYFGRNTLYVDAQTGQVVGGQKFR